MKKIILTITSSLIGVLLIATIILACTHYTAYGIVNDKVQLMEVYKTGYIDVAKTYENAEGKDEVKTVLSKLEASRKENNLSTLFQGAKGFQPKVENKEVKVKEIVENNDGAYFVHFVYSNAQVLVFNGKDYVDKNTTTKETVKYTELWIEVKNSSSFTSYTIYLVDQGLDSSRATSRYQVKCVAQQADLYAYIGTLKEA